jgi:hypothetical protein
VLVFSFFGFTFVIEKPSLFLWQFSIKDSVSLYAVYNLNIDSEIIKSTFRISLSFPYISINVYFFATFVANLFKSNTFISPFINGALITAELNT